MATNTAVAKTAHAYDKALYVSYPQRWFVLATVCLMALSNAMQWMSFESLPTAVSTFYCTNASGQLANASHSLTSKKPAPVQDCYVLYWASQIFQIVGVVTGIFGMYVTDRYGIRVSIYCGALFNFIGAVIRVVSSLESVAPEHRLPLFYIGQTISATAQPFFLCLSPKVAEFWFSEYQRTLANALSFIANPMGVAIGSAVPVIFVSNAPVFVDSKSILWLAAVLTPATIVVVMALRIQSSRPPTPPSASSDCNQTPLFSEGLSMLFKYPMFYVQMVTFGMAFAIQWSFFIMATNMLVKLKYFDKMVGYLLPLSALCGCASSVLFGYLIDRLKKFKEAINISYVGLSVVAILLNIVLRIPRSSEWDIWFLAVLLMALGFFSIPVFPLGLELGVETTFPVAEATSSGVLCIAGQLFMFAMTYGMAQFADKGWIYDVSEDQDPKNYQLSIDFWTISTLAATVFSLVFLRPRYQRLEYEKDAIALNAQYGYENQQDQQY